MVAALAWRLLDGGCHFLEGSGWWLVCQGDFRMAAGTSCWLLNGGYYSLVASGWLILFHGEYGWEGAQEHVHCAKCHPNCTPNVERHKS